MRIDGLDNIEIPTTITISPAVEVASAKEVIKEKTTQFLVGNGFVEIFTNAITNSQYFTPAVLETAVKMMNNLSADLDVLRPSMLETGLETIAYNCNRRNHNLRLFEFGKNSWNYPNLENYTSYKFKNWTPEILKIIEVVSNLDQLSKMKLGWDKKFKNLSEKITDNDVADACGIGHWALKNWGKAIGVDK